MDQVITDDSSPHKRPSLLPPALPIEAAELILFFSPLQFSLASLTGQHNSIHSICAAAFTCLPPHPSGYNGGFNFGSRSTFKTAFEYNRVNVLNWWANTAKLDAPAGDGNGKLDRTLFLTAVDIGLTDIDLTDLMKAGGKQELQAVEMWLLSDIEVTECASYLVCPRCEAGCSRALKAFLKGRGEHVQDFDDIAMDVCISVAVELGHVHVLEWLGREARWPLANDPEWACHYLRMDVLEWYKANKEWVDPGNSWVNELKCNGDGEPKILWGRQGEEIVKWLQANGLDPTGH
ncbi:hypothetical protein BCR44DRAFT_396537 [Catenaria anguillulae PL171]|uniref:Uncharacterized protein n=1 Tax=Catenaria anguillulae PL171 TaxID=765915 RepID=A0A1Y2HYY5_9FUNG|nr:hypothetical protein BCR44DRAFT_396537 [Catenaria anguillulae PL171]